LWLPLVAIFVGNHKGCPYQNITHIVGNHKGCPYVFCFHLSSLSGLNLPQFTPTFCPHNQMIKYAFLIS